MTIPAGAAATSNSEFVIIPEGDVFPEDLYTGAIRVVVEGTIEGDLVAFAAQDVVIEGTVTGSVTAVSPSVVINGVVEGSVRATGNRLEVNGSVERDIVAAVVTAELSPSSTVGGDVILWAWNASALGTIGQDLNGVQRMFSLAGMVGGDVDVSVSRLGVVDDLTVQDMGYRSAHEATGLDNAEVGGAVVAKQPHRIPEFRALATFGRFMVVLFLAIAALTTTYGWPQRTTTAISEVSSRPIRRWASGALVVLAPVLAVVITGLIVGLAPPAAAFPLLAVLIPVVLALFGIALALGLVYRDPGCRLVGWSAVQTSRPLWRHPRRVGRCRGRLVSALGGLARAARGPTPGPGCLDGHLASGSGTFGDFIFRRLVEEVVAHVTDADSTTRLTDRAAQSGDLGFDLCLVLTGCRRPAH